ncbi:type I glyceraldehyde-3-phosphate dehydrogenase [Paenibacillus guangzhouensis]|uniref:type I glyceraldehyde-3-phosphate dehydrogenase n=1 Tax=Paenibacillus guangzhouensis TaxID=1473112 RepID=UPI0022391F7E|nr:type I glyceraldehyde-3-phosphate dehydrogenase [Paenibacillus guangzhouensis]
MGRIGRLLVRRAFEHPQKSWQLRAINCLYPASTIAHLLTYDTVHSKWDRDISVEPNALIIEGQRIEVLSEPDPARLPWEQLGIHTVIDATGKFTDRSQAAQHLEAGAKKVIITSPGKGLDLTVVMGVNENKYDPDRHAIVSAASCTTNCLAPVLHILDDAFQVLTGWMTTIHSYTNDQKHLDNPHRDLRRARACTQSIVPTSTGVGKALGEVIPHLAPVIQGISIRVPTPNVSLIDLTVETYHEVTQEQVRNVFKQAVIGRYASIVQLCEEPLVSTDFIGNDKSSVIDGLSMMTQGSQVKVLAWYDNEWAYACRVIDLAQYMVSQEVNVSEPETVTI